jgi:hypothetical protein
MAGSLRLAHGYGRACLLYALATILREEGNEIVHHLEPRRIDHGTSITADAEQSGKAEPVEVKGKRIRREAEFFGDVTGRHAFRAGLHKQAEDLQAVLLGERG